MNTLRNYIFSNDSESIHITEINPIIYTLVEGRYGILLDITDPNNPLEYYDGEWHPIDKDKKM